MAEVHPLLSRQLQKYSGDNLSSPRACKRFFKVIDETYHEFDNDRAMLERALEISSREHIQERDQMLKVREIALGIESKYTLDEVLEFIVESARQIPGIHLVFLNLVLNAEYAMIHAHKQGKLLVETCVSNGNVVVSFADDGEGIKEENLKKIFQPFFTTKEVGVGTGLGLSLCYGIIKRHGGSINVSSKYGSGTKFTVELPNEIKENDGVESESN
ncbi:MAG TPA: ATP-binding protein [Dehalococcoidales bacterium]|nr:ATP-binding protein [Dehalococcoidales bacterium]